MEPDNPALDDFALSLTGAREPRVLFLPTASGDPAAQIQAFRQRFGGRAVPRRRPVAVPPPRTPRARSPTSSARRTSIYVGGGSMRNLLAIWRTHGLDECLHEAWQARHRPRRAQRRRDVLVRGRRHQVLRPARRRPPASAGCPARSPSTPTASPSACRSGSRRSASGALPGGWAADDGVGLLWRGTELERIVSSRPGTTALRVDCVGGELVRRRETPELLEAPARGGLRRRAGAPRRPAPPPLGLNAH